MNFAEALKNQSASIRIPYDDGGYHYYDPRIAQRRRQEDDAWRIRYQEILAETNRIPPVWLAVLGRGLRRLGESAFGRIFINWWLNFVIHVVSMHVVPALWRIDEFFKKGSRVESRKLRGCVMTDLAKDPWFEGNTWISPSGFFRYHIRTAVAVGILVFVLTSPMLILSIPYAFLARNWYRVFEWRCSHKFSR